MIWNPKPHVQHAWSDTGTIYAKAGLVIFYAWLWINVVWAVYMIIFPTTGLECIFDSAHKANRAFLAAMIRGLNILLIGVLGYADVAGLHVKNVAYVFVVTLFLCLAFLPVVPITNEVEGCAAISYGQIALCPSTVFVALLLTMVDKHVVSSGSNTGSGETSPLRTQYEAQE